MADLSSSSSSSLDGSNSRIGTISAQIMIATIIVFFFVVAFCFFLHLYAKWYYSTHEDPTTVSWRRRMARNGRPTAAAIQRRGLDPTALRSLPVVVYNPKDFKDGLECAVCLSEVLEGEKARILPNCNHGFHVDCIDMWFQCHSTCPLCRNPVISSENPSNNHSNNDVNNIEVLEMSDDDDDSSNGSGQLMQAPNFPTNVLFWGDETQVSSSDATNSASASSSNINGVGRSREELVIEIPRDVCADCLSSPPMGTQVVEEEAKTPVMTRLRSLKRLLSRGKKVAASPCETSSGDIEQV